MVDLPRKKQTHNRGFTLVELIVVLVILAILAALLVPALTGYIDRAKHQAVIVNGRAALVAAQSLNAGYYAKDQPDANPPAADVLALAEVPGEIKQMEFVHHVLQTTEATPFMYKEGNTVAVFKDGVWSIEGDATTPAAGSGGFTVDDSVTNEAVRNFFLTGWSTAADDDGNEATYKTFTVGSKTYCLAWYTGDKGTNNELENAIKQAHPDVSNFDFQIKGKDESQSSSAVQDELSAYLGLEKKIDRVSFTDTGAVMVTMKS